MTTNHKYYLNLAFQIAKKNLGKTKLNPSVGTVIVKNKTIINIFNFFFKNNVYARRC